MTAEPCPFDLNDAIEHYRSGESLTAVASRYSDIITYAIYQHLRATGVMRGRAEWVRPDRVTVDDDALVAAYLSGKSEKSLVENFGISRPAI